MNTKTTDPQAVGTAIDGVVTDPIVPALVAAYYDDPNGFAGTTFDLWKHDEDPDHFTPTDFWCVSLLNVTVGPSAGRELLGTARDEVSDLLTRLDTTATLWEADETTLGTMSVLWHRLRQLEGVDWVTANKLCARKRPDLFPIVDSVVKEHLGILGDDAWTPLGEALRDEDRRGCILRLQPKGVPTLSVLRLLDVATWMLHSQGERARRQREQATAASAPS